MALICVLSSGPYTSKHIVIPKKIPPILELWQSIYGKSLAHMCSAKPNVTTISHIWPKRACYLGIFVHNTPLAPELTQGFHWAKKPGPLTPASMLMHNMHVQCWYYKLYIVVFMFPTHFKVECQADWGYYLLTYLMWPCFYMRSQICFKHFMPTVYI